MAANRDDDLKLLATWLNGVFREQKGGHTKLRKNVREAMTLAMDVYGEAETTADRTGSTEDIVPILAEFAEALDNDERLRKLTERA